MRNYHAIIDRWEPYQIEILEEYGIKAPLGHEWIRIYDEQLYKKLEPLFKQWESNVHFVSDFSEDDYANADHLGVYATMQSLYPQPEDGFGYLDLTYDLKDYCKSCDVGKVQKNPFRIKKRVKWNKRVAFVLHWVFDEIFVRSDIYEKLFAPIGVGFMPVLLKSGTVIEDIKQLKIDVTKLKLKLDDRAFEICTVCGRIRYVPLKFGFFPDFIDNINVPPIVKSQEYYGTGASAHKWIIVSQSFRQTLVKEKINFKYYPSKPKFQ